MLRRVATDLQAFGEQGLPPDAPGSFLLLLELIYRDILVYEQLNGNRLTSGAGTLVSSALATMRGLNEQQQHEYTFSHPSGTPALHSGSVGRPRFNIPEEQLQFLVESGFTGQQIAEIIGVSLRTVRRRMADYGLSIGDQYADIPDDELERVVIGIKAEFPTCGQKQMMGHLRSRGYRVQQVRVREVMRRIDPEGSIMRCLSALNRRRYSVLAPGSLWHMDGNHKLIRYVCVYQIYNRIYSLLCITAGGALLFMAALMATAGVSCTSLAIVITVQRQYCNFIQLRSLNLVCLVVCEQIEGVKMWM